MFTKKNTPPKLQRTLDGVRKEKDSLLTNPDGPLRRASRNQSIWLSKVLSKKRIIAGGMATLILIVGVSTYFSEEIKGATYGWTQSSWIGGIDITNKATHTDNQTNWTKYYFKDSNIQADANGVTITGTANSWIQTSDSDFNAGTNDGIVVSGGAVSSLRPPGASCTSYTQCTSYSCTGNICGSDNGCGIAQDEEGNRYGSIVIGTQCWLNKNLNVGTMLASGSTLPTNNGTVEKWCYNNDPNLCATEGGLYHWDEAMKYSITPGTQGICPTGWHIPTDAEQYTLENYLKDEGQTCNASRSNAYDCNTAGTKLKVGGTSGFNGILAGYRSTDSTFSTRGTDTRFWSSSPSGSSALRRSLYSGSSGVDRDLRSKASGFSVRCLKD